MNKKCVTILAGAAAGILTLTGCGDETYTYDVSGTVEARQVDYDCPGEDVAMDAVAFVVGKGRGSGSGGGGGSKSGSSKGGTSSKKSDSGGEKSDSSSSTGGTTSSKKPTPTPSKRSTGVKLSKKPDKPEKVTSVPKPFTGKKPKGCETEYELYIRNGDGLFEQDVRHEDYENCSEGEKFATCTD